MVDLKMGREKSSIVLRNRKSGYTTTITPYKEDLEYWYVIETKDGDISRLEDIQNLLLV